MGVSTHPLTSLGFLLHLHLLGNKNKNKKEEGPSVCIISSAREPIPAVPNQSTEASSGARDPGAGAGTLSREGKDSRERFIIVCVCVKKKKKARS